MKTNIKKFGFSLVATLALCLSSAMPAQAAFLNLGTLDVAPADENSQGWFNEYLAPGESLQRTVRVSNFGAETKYLEIYASDATTVETTISGQTADPLFYAKSRAEKSDDIAGWIRLPSDELTLEAGESAILSVNFVTPKNAGVGLHTAAIMFREKNTAPYGEITLEKGVRIYLNITGPVINAVETTSATVSASANAINLSVTTANTGTTDAITAHGLELREFLGNGAVSTQNKTRVHPQTAPTETISVQKPAFGIYSAYAVNGNESAYLGTFVFIPLWALLVFLSATLLAVRPSFVRPSFSFNPNAIAANYLTSLKGAIQSPAVKQAFVYFGVFTIMFTGTLYLSAFGRMPAGAQSMTSRPAHTYELTVKWGNFRGVPIPDSYRKRWEGEMRFTDAKVNIIEYLNFESTDGAEISDNNTRLSFKNTTGPDNDGIILRVESISDKIPSVTYMEKGTQEQFTFLMTDYLDAAGVYPSGLAATHLQTSLGPEHELTAIALDLEATPSAEALPEFEATPALVANIPELNYLFVEDLPATPEALADFILMSGYVDDVTTERQTKRVTADPLLISALSATPEVLSEISASPDLNFIYIPDEIVKFPPQEFSFNETKVTVENIGPMIFVQNRNTPWNTYVGTTNFTSLSGDSVIPAYSLTIVPGEAVMLVNPNGAKVEPGNARSFKGTTDKSVLVNVEPGTITPQIFVLNPQLQFRIPPNTLPGHYRGSLTITSL